MGTRGRRRPTPLALEHQVAAIEEAQRLKCKELECCLEEAIIVDVRGADFKGGHLPKAENLPFEELLEDPALLEALADRVQQLRPRKSLVCFVCMYGEQRSRLCAEKFASLLKENFIVLYGLGVGPPTGGGSPTGRSQREP